MGGGYAAPVAWVGRQRGCKGAIWDLERRAVELLWYVLRDKSSPSSSLRIAGRYSPPSRLEWSQPPPHRVEVGHLRDETTHEERRVILSLNRGCKIAEHSWEFLARWSRRWKLGHMMMTQDFSWPLPLVSLAPFCGR